MSWWDDLRRLQAGYQAPGMSLSAQWGFQLNTVGLFTQLPGGDVMNAELPTGEAVPWTVSLNGWRYQSGPLTPGLNVPADNQTAATGQTYARLTWGTSGQSETALVDYPSMGSTFGVNASSVRVGLASSQPLSPFGSPAPMLSGSLTPLARMGAPGLGPTYTQFANVPATGVVVVPRPRRAVAYRVMVAQPVVVGDLTYRQSDGTGTVGFVRDSSVSTAGLGEGYADARAQWFPFTPVAQTVLISNGNVAVSYDLYVQFILDLGG